MQCSFTRKMWRIFKLSNGQHPGRHSDWNISKSKSRFDFCGSNEDLKVTQLGNNVQQLRLVCKRWNNMIELMPEIWPKGGFQFNIFMGLTSHFGKRKTNIRWLLASLAWNVPEEAKNNYRWIWTKQFVIDDRFAETVFCDCWGSERKKTPRNWN